MYTIADYIAAIDREMAKRQTTYPKIITKMQHRQASPRRMTNEMRRQSLQNCRLLAVRNALAENLYAIDAHSASQYLDELKREMKMRESVYDRFVLFRRISPEVAEEQKALWRSLIAYWNETYCGLPF